MKHLSISLLFALLSSHTFAKDTADIHLGLFSQGQLNNWNTKEFSGTTNYQLTQLNDKQVLKAESQSSASGLFKEQKIDLQKTPVLNWQWRIESHLGKINEQSKEGDDYSARIYVLVDGGWAFWKTKAINYVWSSNTSKGTVWPNAFAGNSAMMIAVRSSKDDTHTWYHEKRNIKKDLQEHFGTDFQYIDAVAIMTDTDNTKGSATAYYGDIYFSEK